MPTLIAASSGRALAQAARRSGAAVRVIDWFADDDTAALAEMVERVPPAADGAGFDRERLARALDRLAPGVDRIVYGAGFESEPGLIDLLAAHAPVAGNSANLVRRLKSPADLANLLGDIGARHPAIRFDPPSEPGWLAKRIGGSGGAHVRAADGGACDAQSYFQREVSGDPISVLFAADGANAAIIGYSLQWTAPTAAAPFRYGGCAGPIALPSALDSALTSLCNRLAAATGLIGLNGIDCLIAADGAIWVVEVNPRPVASIDLFDRLGGLSLWTAHLDACQGSLPDRPLFPAVARAASVVYASNAFVMPGGFVWPGEAVDHTPGGTTITAGDPICSLVTDAPDASAARAANNEAAERFQQRLARHIRGASQ